MFGVELFSDRTLTLSNYLSGKCGHSNNGKWFTVVYFWFENNLKPDLDDLAPSCASYTGLDEVWMNYFFFCTGNTSLWSAKRPFIVVLIRDLNRNYLSPIATPSSEKIIKSGEEKCFQLELRLSDIID